MIQSFQSLGQNKVLGLLDFVGKDCRLVNWWH